MLVNLNDNGVTIATADLHEGSLRECAIIVYEGRHYVFDGLHGKFFTTLNFVKVNDPLHLEFEPKPKPPPAPVPEQRKFIGAPSSKGEAL